MKKKLLNICIIGFGNIGKKRYRAIKKIKNFNIKINFIIEKNLKIKKYISKEIKFFNKYDILEKKKLDLVILCTPTKITEKILKKYCGKFNFLVEKPISTKINLLKKFISKSSSSKKIIKVGYNLRFDNGIKKIKDNMSKLGNIYHVKISYANGSAKTNTNKIGSLLDIGLHSVNLLKWLLPNEKFKLINNYQQKNEFEKRRMVDNGLIIFQNKNTLATIHHGFCNWKNDFKLEIFGSKGGVICESLPKWGRQKVVFYRRRFPSGKPFEKVYTFSKDVSWKKEILFTLNAINEKNFISDINSESLQTLNLVKKFI